jgi:hypothetical protein
MFALVSAHIDQIRGALYSVDRSLDYVLGRRHKRDHRSVVIGIDMRIKHTRSLHRADGRGYLRNRLRPSAFAKIRNTLN